MPDHKLYPEIEPYSTGTLNVSDIHTIFYEEAGNPDGKPALFLHGGPGVGINPGYRRFFDPGFYRAILPDQRGAGRSTPHAEIEENTTWDIVDDLEKLREHLGVDKWLVMGGSWGSTLALSYAITYPDSIAGIIIRGVFLARPFEIEWLHKPGGASRIYPDKWEKYLEAVPEDKRGNTARAYYEMLTSEDDNIRSKAAKAWSSWEGAITTLFPDEQALAEMTEDKTSMSIGRIECYYTINNFFMKSDNYLLENINNMRGIPVRIVQGRYDIICPVQSAWDLHKALPDSELVIVPNGAHSPMDEGMAGELVKAAEEFKKLF
ncbi:MAG: prolyl aminopeptidase [candidate division Zixibacteria bacterium]|nr:prolyl aminopeptidase [candidate division Zixibacteria bacterium]